METPTHYTTPRPEGHIEGFTYFCRTNRSSIFIILSMLLLTYGFMLFHFSFSIDTEACVVLQMNFYKGWIGINRYGLVFTKWLTGLLSLIPGFAAVLMVLTTFGYSLAWMYFFHWIKGRDLSRTELNWVFPVLFFSSVPMVELSNFQCQSFEVAFAMLLCAAALLLEWQWILSGGILRLLLSVMLGVWCFASYQAFVPVYISASLASFLLAYHYRSDEIGSRVFLVSVKLASVFLCDYLICTLLGKILMFLARVEAGTYTDNMIRWGKAPLDEIITSLKLYINDTVLAKNIFWNRWYLFAAVGLLLSAFWKLRKKKRGTQILSVFYFRDLPAAGFAVFPARPAGRAAGCPRTARAALCRGGGYGNDRGTFSGICGNAFGAWQGHRACRRSVPVSSYFQGKYCDG